ncbi:MAG: hypothetical protein H7123_05685 [Thermoleophilia bacterium]|nr:hypothetical protein [Thermoleophilia bacterium]
MAQITFTSNATPTLSGWSISSHSPAVLAAIPDAIVQRLGVAHDTLTLWACHPSEQDGLREAAYQDERTELGIYAQCEVIELARPHRPNTVWLDRFHLVATSAPASIASRVAGLYVGGDGSPVGHPGHNRLALWLHDPSVTMQLVDHARSMPLANGAGWDLDAVALSCRCSLLVDARRPGVVELRCPPMFAPAIGETLLQLSQLVASW